MEQRSGWSIHSRVSQGGRARFKNEREYGAYASMPSPSLSKESLN